MERRQDRKLKPQVEKERWRLLTESLERWHEGKAMAGWGASSGGQAKRNDVVREKIADTGAGGTNQVQGKT